MIIPAGKKVGDSAFGKIYEDKEGAFWCLELSLINLIEASVSRGRGYIETSEKSQSQLDKFPGFMKDLREGHPCYSKAYHTCY
jgi:hypothetical protein